MGSTGPAGAVVAVSVAGRGRTPCGGDDGGRSTGRWQRDTPHGMTPSMETAGIYECEYVGHEHTGHDERTTHTLPTGWQWHRVVDRSVPCMRGPPVALCMTMLDLIPDANAECMRLVRRLPCRAPAAGC